MKITIGPISLDLLLFFRLWWPATVFIGVCIGIFVAFIVVLPTIAQNAPPFLGGVWLLLLIFYIILGVVFTRFAARRLRASFGLEELRIRRRMAILSGFPFYALGLLYLMVSISGFLPGANDFTVVVGGAGFLGFALVSGSYLLLLRFFLGRSTAIAHQPFHPLQLL